MEYHSALDAVAPRVSKTTSVRPRADEVPYPYEVTPRLSLLLVVTLAFGCGGDDSGTDAAIDTAFDASDDASSDASNEDSGTDAAVDATADATSDAAEDADAAPDASADAAADVSTDATDAAVPPGCGDFEAGTTTITLEFPSGNRDYVVPRVEDSFGECPAPTGTEFADTFTPGPGECSVATHDRYWVRGTDGRVYRTWHPPTTTDVETGAPCSFGHEHGDDPRESPLYMFASGVPFGFVNHVAVLNGFHRHEDHYGHKVYVQDLYQAAVGNGPSDEPIAAAGFHCYWLSKIHQGTHSGDALRRNMHEYQNAVVCDDGAARTADPGFEINTGPTHHTAHAVKTLTFWGQPGSFKACSGLDRTITGTTADGVVPPDDSDTNREIKCARASEGWLFKALPEEIVSRTGDPDYAPSSAGIDELWKPWMHVFNREGQRIFLASPYYVVRDPIRVYNDGSMVPRRDVDGDGMIDNWIPTLEACIASEMTFGQCSDLPAFPSSVPMTEWWRLPESPFRGVVRVVHPKGITVANRSARTLFCTDHLGMETADDPTMTAGIPSCPEGQLLQRVAATQNMWFGRASWGPAGARGGISATMVNSRSDVLPSGYGHEWVRFADATDVHAPN